ncbi:probable acetyltransferase [Leucobacter sp. 7(1)]|uniref:GNAT family N-acetyltransferase n=1 Tax=Leucobacter sp. 7(1) TaxID=1255613 RepID=UPI00097F3743|nr:probable acetyltransferase [Leucobacter sp. 7(1)]
MVFGAFEGDTLVAVGSSYPFEEDGALADMGVVTHPDHRGHGHARSVIRALARAALAADHEPQYRCQIDNTASVKLASRSGFVSIGTWDLPLPGDTE